MPNRPIHLRSLAEEDRLTGIRDILVTDNHDQVTCSECLRRFGRGTDAEGGAGSPSA